MTVEVQLHSFSNSVLDGVRGQLYVQASHPPPPEGVCITYFIHTRLVGSQSLSGPFGKYRVIQKDGLNFVRLYFLNYTWYVNDLHNI